MERSNKASVILATGMDNLLLTLRSGLDALVSRLRDINPWIALAYLLASYPGLLGASRLVTQYGEYSLTWCFGVLLGAVCLPGAIVWMLVLTGLLLLTKLVAAVKVLFPL